jgi:hypothetical protein
MFLKGARIGKALPLAATTSQGHEDTSTEEYKDEDKGMEVRATPFHKWECCGRVQG